MKTGFIYLWTNAVNGKKYLGSHIGSPDDGYIGSGLAFNSALKKYGLGSFNREILENNIPQDKVLTREQYHLDESRAAYRSDYYNIAPNAGGGRLVTDYSVISAKTAEANRKNGTYERARARMKVDNPNKDGSTRKKYFERTGEYPKYTERELSPSARQKLADKMIGATNPCFGIPPWLHPRRTEETISIWKRADELHDWWLEHQGSYLRMSKAFGYTRHVGFMNVVKRFQQGWNPREDPQWLEFSPPE